MNDKCEILIELDSICSLKDLLITVMEICSESEFKLEIHMDFGRISELVTVRTPSYAIAGIQLLNRLLQLPEQFLSTDSDPYIF